jgi:hypothetical protein
MSNKKLKPNDLKRDSFSDRICDDLFEVLLKYLSFEDKIRFECVSKQWQKLIFNKQFIIDFNPYSRSKSNFLNKLVEKCPKNENESQIIISKFEKLLKKCKFIEEFSLINISIVNNEQVLKLITNYCKHLKKIRFDFENVSEKSLKQFGIELGQQLRSIDFSSIVSIENYRLLLRLCPNLREVFNVKIDGLIDGNHSLVPKLETTSRVYRLNDKQIINTFFNGCKNSLKSLRIDFEEVRDKEFLMKEISNLENLECLEFTLLSDEDIDNSFAENLKLIANKCSKIKRLDLNSCFINSKLQYKTFVSIHCFTQLKRLEINFFKSNEAFKEIIAQSFDGCKQLTHLKIICFEMNDNFFKDIDLYLPQLTHLKVGKCKDFTDYAMKSLAKMDKLKVVSFTRFKSRDFEITDSGLCDLVNNCPSIQSINFETKANITIKTINALIELALKKPRIYFSHYLGPQCFGIWFGTDLTNHYPIVKLPNNLNIITNGFNFIH